MTEPQVPEPDWDSLPVLTEIVETPVAPTEALPPQVEVPVLVDFDIPDFDFSAEMAQLADALPDTGLSFPPELTLDEVLSAGEQSPVAAADGALDAEALIGRLPSLDLDVPLPDDMDLGEVLPGFAMPETVADVAPAATDDVAPWPTDMPDAGAATLPAEMPLEAETLAAERLPDDEVLLPAAEPSDDEERDAAGVPESSLVDVDNAPLLDTVEAELTAAAAAAGLAAWLDQAAQVAPPDAAPQADVRVDTVPWEASTADAVQAIADVEMTVEAAESAPEAAVVPEAAAAALDEVSPGFVAASVEAEGDAVPVAGDAVAEVATVIAEPPRLSDEAFVPADVVPAAGEVVTADEDAAAGDEFAFDLGAAEGAAPAGVAAAYVAALDTAPDASVPVHAYPLGESISLDSLPTGVLGGGLGLAASLVAELDGGGAGDMIPDREVELAWARDLGAEPPFDLTPQDAVLPVHQVLSAPSPAAAVPEEAGLAAAAIQLSGVKEVSQPPAVVPEAAAEVPPSLDSEALIDALYARVLPRMKVELTLWMQDALEMQARQLMSGVMQHLKEDFDMMLAEALRESLREALREAKAGQGEQ